MIPLPPHCPFDSIVIGHLPGCGDLNWTSINSKEDYLRLVRTAENVAQNSPLSEWELKVWGESSPVVVSTPVIIEKRKENMKVHYDAEVDAVYIKLGSQKPDGVVEISEGVNLDTTSENRIVGIEILNASQKMNINTILSYELELDKKLIKKTA